jgi:acetyltransferase-like isoleucine patch superfamily enzyme
MLSRIATKLHTLSIKYTYPFCTFGTGTVVHHSCEIKKSASREISLGSDVYVGPHVWLNVAYGSESSSPKIVIGTGCQIGRRSTISSRNEIILEANVLLAPSVLIMDHNHEFSNTEMPIHSQGLTAGGRIVIGRNSWLGHGAVVICSRNDLILGRNSVVAANAVVTRSFPDFSVVAGNPAKLVRKFDQEVGRWVRIRE